MIIVGITSWKKRIDGCVETIKSLLDQDFDDYTIELNLDYKNFPLGIMELPVSLLDLTENSKFKIKWISQDLKCWQKIAPTIWRHREESYTLVTCDDDVTYPRTYLSEIAENIRGNDWLCTRWPDITQGQYMTYGPRAIDALLHHVDLPLIRNCPLDDHPIYWIIKKYNLKRGAPIQSVPVDRKEGYSFRRYFVDVEDPSQLKDSSCDYPIEQFKRERAYMKMRGYADGTGVELEESYRGRGCSSVRDDQTFYVKQLVLRRLSILRRQISDRHLRVHDWKFQVR